MFITLNLQCVKFSTIALQIRKLSHTKDLPVLPLLPFLQFLMFLFFPPCIILNRLASASLLHVDHVVFIFYKFKCRYKLFIGLNDMSKCSLCDAMVETHTNDYLVTHHSSDEQTAFTTTICVCSTCTLTFKIVWHIQGVS